MSMGILPGAPIGLVQRFPSYVFQVRQEQFAVDREIADSIYVRLIEAGTPGGEERREQGRQHVWQRFPFRQRRPRRGGKAGHTDA